MEGVNKALTVVKNGWRISNFNRSWRSSDKPDTGNNPGRCKKSNQSLHWSGKFLCGGNTASAASNKFEGTMDSIIKAVQVFTEEGNKSEEEVTGAEA